VWQHMPPLCCMKASWGDEMSRLTIHALVLGVLGLLLIGCGGDQGEKASAKADTGTNQVTKAKKAAVRPRAPIDAMPATGVVVRVNGHDVTKAEYATWENLRCRIRALSMGRNPAKPDEDLMRFRRSGRMAVLGELIKREQVRQYAKEKGIVAPPEKIRQQEREHLRLIRRGKATWEKGVGDFPADEAKMFREDVVTGRVLLDEVLKGLSTNDIFTVTDEHVRNRIASDRKYNEMVDALNATNRLRAVRAREEILTGTGSNLFAVVTSRVADTNAWEGAEWDTVTLDEFDADDPLARWLSRAEMGDISEPLVLEDGLSIVGVKRKYPADVPDEAGQTPPDEYELVRCYFYYYDKRDEITDRKELEKDIIASRRMVALQQLEEILKPKLKIEFPSGNNLFHAKGSQKKGKVTPNPKKKSAKKKSQKAKSPKVSGISDKKG